MTTQDYNDLLVSWLKNAHAMETSLIKVLENQAERASVFPELSSRLRGHREESQRHANLLEGCIERRGGEISQLRTGVSKLMADVESSFLGAFEDSIVKDTILGVTSERTEIASYTAIIALANELGDEKTVEICEEILEDEIKMEEFLTDNLPELVHEAFERDLLTS